MKNATKYAETFRSLIKLLQKETKPGPMQKLDPLKALVRGAMSYDVSESLADQAMSHIEREFVNLNELRVATDLEIQELLGLKYPVIQQRVETITGSLNAIFEQEHTLSLDRLKTISRKDARQFVRDLPGMNPFVEAFVMMFGFEAPAMPVDQETVNYFRGKEIFDEKTTPEDAQRFLEHNIKAEECYEFFALLRRAVYAEKNKKKA
jgi:endonuclease III